MKGIYPLAGLIALAVASLTVDAAPAEAQSARFCAAERAQGRFPPGCPRPRPQPGHSGQSRDTNRQRHSGTRAVVPSVAVDSGPVCRASRYVGDCTIVPAASDFYTATVTGRWTEVGANANSSIIVRAYPGATPEDDSTSRICGQWVIGLTVGDSIQTRSCVIYLEAGRPYVVRAREIDNIHATSREIGLQLQRGR